MKRIAELRKRDAISQYELAEKLGVSQQTVSKYERGLVQPDTESLLKMANLFDVSVDYLIERTDIPKNENLEDIPRGIYMRLAKEAQNMQLDEKDVEYIIDMYKRFRKMNE